MWGKNSVGPLRSCFCLFEGRAKVRGVGSQDHTALASVISDLKDDSTSQ